MIKNDGGWNCDKNPTTNISSYHESLIPLRALNEYSILNNNSKVQETIDKASEVFLKRYLYKNLHNGKIIHPTWIKLSYPPYWHYNIFMALNVLSEANKIRDKRCNDALDILESKQLPDGGFPAEIRYYKNSKSNISPVH